MTDEYVPRYFTKEHGLPDNQVQAIVQTRDGYLWTATRAGLARFDGQKFTVFNRLNAAGLTNDDCRALIEDADGKLLVRAWYDWFSYTGHQSPAFEKLPDLQAGTIWSVCSSRSGWLWASKINSLSRVQNGRIIESFTSSAWGGDSPHAVVEDHLGIVWIGLGGGALHFDPQTKQFERHFPNPDFAIVPVLALSPHAAGGCWMLLSELAPRTRHAWLACIKDDQWLRRPRFESPDIECDPRSFFLVEDQSGALWLPAFANSLHRFKNGEFQRVSIPPTGRDDFVLSVYPDREGNLWVGTESSGLQCWQPRRISSYTTRDGLANDSTWTICEARDGSMWIGTEEGVSQLNAGRFRNFTQRDSLSKDPVRSIAEDSAGSIWIGTGGGLNVFRDGVLRRQPFPHEPEKDKTRIVYPARDGTLWLGTADGLFHFMNGAWKTFRTTNGLANNDVRALLEDQAGNLWIGTAGGGVQLFRNGTFTTFSTTNGLSNNSAWALHEDNEGAIWIGTEGGLSRLQQGRFTTYTTREGLPDNLVNAILEDDFGRLWVSHDRGIYWVRREELNALANGRIKTLRCVTYDESDGLPSIETNGQKSNPAACKTRDGRLWFPTTKGVAIIDPSKVGRDDVPPLAAIEQVRANGSVLYDSGPHTYEQPSGVAKANKAIGQAVRTNPQPSTLIHQLPPGSARVLEFRYVANTFVAPEKARFKYRLRGLDDHWVEAEQRREAYFTDLRSGDYQFEVLACNYHGVWQESGATFAFQIAPFIHQTWWFWVACGAAVAGLVVGVVTWRIRELRKIHSLEQQAAITAERTRIAKDLHDGLGADLTRLTMLADLASGETGSGGGEHLKKLSQSSRAAARELKELIWVANPANDSVDGLISRICQNAEDFLRDARIKCRLDVAPNLPKQPLTIEQRRNLLLVVREALNNVVKHAGATEVCIRAAGNDGTLSLVIEDNGRGFDANSVRSDGLGLDSMRKRIENLGGLFTLESWVGAGTKITIGLTLIRLS